MSDVSYLKYPKLFDVECLIPDTDPSMMVNVRLFPILVTALKSLVSITVGTMDENDCSLAG